MLLIFNLFSDYFDEKFSNGDSIQLKKVGTSSVEFDLYDVQRNKTDLIKTHAPVPVGGPLLVGLGMSQKFN